MTAQSRIAATGVAAAHSVFAVPGMRCAACISKIERGLGEIPGIIAARVNFTARQVAVDHLPTMTVPDLREAIGLIGFEAEQRVGDGDQRRRLAERRRRDQMVADDRDSPPR